MSVFLSKVSSPPYSIVDTLNPDIQSVVVDGVGGRDVLTIRTPLYLIIEGESWTTLEIRVENENITGISLFISTTDIIGNPESWAKKIVLHDVNGDLTPSIGLMIEWRIINNIYFAVADQINVNINVYGV